MLRNAAANANNNGNSEQPPIDTNVQIGQADAGLEIDTKIFPLALRVPKPSAADDPTPAFTLARPLNPTQLTYASNSLPSSLVLRSRATVYKSLNSRLERETLKLRNESAEVEATLREVVALCTGTKVGDVDGIVEGLGRAVGSEEGENMGASAGGEGHADGERILGKGGLDVNRVREFLRRVEGAE